MQALGFGVLSSWFRGSGSEFRVWELGLGLRFGVWGLKFRVRELGFRSFGLGVRAEIGYRIKGLGFRV